MDELTPDELAQHPISARCLKTIESGEGGIDTLPNLAKALVTAIADLEREVIALRAVVAK